MKRFILAKMARDSPSWAPFFASQSRASSSINTCPYPSPRIPWFVMVGGGMASGKTSAAVAQSHWLSLLGRDVVIIDPDEFKKKNNDGAPTDQKAHKDSIKAAEELLVASLNEGRDIVLEGTMSWLPYVIQTIEMVRDAHRHTYKRSSVGYLGGDEEGSEEYWERAGERSSHLSAPYAVKVAGVTVDPLLAVERAQNRSQKTGRSVPKEAQLRSLKLFAQGFDQYCLLADSAILYDNNAHKKSEKALLSSQGPPIIAEKAEGGELLIRDSAAFRDFLRHSRINHHSTSEEDLWLRHSDSPDWKPTAINQQSSSF